MFECLIVCIDDWFDGFKLASSWFGTRWLKMIQNLSGKALEWWKLLVAYEADDEAHMDGFEDFAMIRGSKVWWWWTLPWCDEASHDVEMRLFYDAIKRSMMWDRLGLIQTGSSQACW